MCMYSYPLIFIAHMHTMVTEKQTKQRRGKVHSQGYRVRSSGLLPYMLGRLHNIRLFRFWSKTETSEPGGTPPIFITGGRGASLPAVFQTYYPF